MDSCFVPYTEHFPRLRYCNCPNCLGVMTMPTENELEERVTELIDKQREDIEGTIYCPKIEKTGKGGDAE